MKVAGSLSRQERGRIEGSRNDAVAYQFGTYIIPGVESLPWLFAI